jgi:hypothetical protein
LTQSKRPVIVLGSGVFERQDGAAVFSLASRLAEKLREQSGKDGWRVFNILQRVNRSKADFVHFLEINFYK